MLTSPAWQRQRRLPSRDLLLSSEGKLRGHADIAARQRDEIARKRSRPARRDIEQVIGGKAQCQWPRIAHRVPDRDEVDHGEPVDAILESGDTIVKAFIHAGAWALLSIAILLWIVLKRIGDVLLTLLPLVLLLLLKGDSFFYVGANIAANVLLGLLAAWLGSLLARSL